MTDKARAKRFNGYVLSHFKENSSAEREFRCSANTSEHDVPGRSRRDIPVSRSMVSLDLSQIELVTKPVKDLIQPTAALLVDGRTLTEYCSRPRAAVRWFYNNFGSLAVEMARA